MCKSPNVEIISKLLKEIWAPMCIAKIKKESTFFDDFDKHLKEHRLKKPVTRNALGFVRV